jgi:glucarate dehydratase
MSTNMCVTRFSHLPEAVKLKPIDVLLLDLHYWGGIVGCQAVGAFCDAAGWKGSQHSNSHAGVTMSAMIHMASVVPQLTLASDTHYPWLVDHADILDGPKLPIKDGRMSIPEGPGLGVRIDPDKLAKAHEVYLKCGMTERDDGSLMRKLEPGWTGKQL